MKNILCYFVPARLRFVLLMASGLLSFVKIHAQPQQKIDSLLNVLKTAKEDTNKVKILNELSKNLFQTGQYEHAMQYANEVLIIATQSEMKGVKFLEIQKGKAFAYNIIGNTYLVQGNYPEALKNYFSSLKIGEDLGDKQRIATSYNNIGNVYYDQGNYSEALKNDFASLKIKEELGDKYGIASSYNNIGNVYYDQGNYSEALKNDFASLKIKEELGDKYGIAISYNNIGDAYQGQGNYPEALKNYFSSLKIREELADKYGIVSCYIGLGSVNIMLKTFAEAKKYLADALALSKEIGRKDAIQESYSSLAALDSAQGNYKAAYENYKQFIIYRDSLFNEENTKKSTRAEMNYEFNKKEQQIKFKHEKETALLTLENSRNRYVIYGLSGVGLLLIIISILLIHQQKLKAKRKSVELKQKLLRSQMSPHFIFNSLNAIQNFIYKNNTKESAKYLASFAKLMRMILENSREEYVPLEKEISTLELYLGLQCLRFQNKFDFSFTVDPAIDSAHTAVPPMLAQPFIENAIEHGFKQKETKGHIDIRFIKLNNNNIIFEVEDNGIGRKNAEKLKSVSLEKHKSLATDITKERVAMLNKKHTAKIKLDIIDIEKDGANCGTKVVFSLPFKLFEAPKFALS